MKKFIVTSIIFSMLSTLLMSCGSPPKKEELSSVSPGNGLDSLSEDVAIYLGVTSTWEMGGASTDHGSCSFSSLESTGLKNCTIKIPEGKMYYSDITFTYGTKMAALCPRVVFRPYYYQRSATNIILEGDESATDCSGTKPQTTAKCWGGAGPVMVDGFPANTGSYISTSITAQSSETLESSNSKRFYGSLFTNLSATSNLPPASRGTAIANGPTRYYVDETNATSIARTQMRDYLVSCEDLWAHPLYQIRLYLNEEDTEGADGTIDEIPDWQT